jgi:hypothetical protein
MPYLTPRFGRSSQIAGPYNTPSNVGAVMFAGAPANAKGAYVDVLTSAQMTDDAYGVEIFFGGVAGNQTFTAQADIAIGTPGNEKIVIADLIAGPVNNGAVNPAIVYYFPLKFRSGVAIRARAACSSATKTMICGVRPLIYPQGPDGWYGSRVTTYGMTSGGGTDVLAGLGSYGTITRIVSGTANPIRALQIGVAQTPATVNAVEYANLYVGSSNTLFYPDWTYLVNVAPVVGNQIGNMLLAHARFNIAAGEILSIAACGNSPSPFNDRQFAFYGVD